jgi:cell division protein ZapA (FtsZ GTPase activity inhibitor)
MPSNDKIQGVLVQIGGDEYKIGGNPHEVRSVAAYVDGKIQEILKSQKSRPSKEQVAVLAAMEIAAELMRVVGERNAVTQKAHENIDRLSRLVDERAQLFQRRQQKEDSPLERLFRDQALPVED